MKNFLLPVTGLLAGCVPTLVDVPLDLDGDGLLADDPDPENEDADGDGHLDGDEVNAGTDPLDAESHPYKGGYEVDSECNNDIQATGNSVGDISEDFEAMDQFGEMVRLHDFCGKVVLLTSGAFW
jgi:hypothetical protein